MLLTRRKIAVLLDQTWRAAGASMSVINVGDGASSPSPSNGWCWARTKPGRYPLWGAYYFRWWVRDSASRRWSISK